MLAAAFLDDFSSKWRRREVSTAATNEGGVKGSRSRARWELRFVLATSGFGFSRRRHTKGTPRSVSCHHSTIYATVA